MSLQTNESPAGPQDMHSTLPALLLLLLLLSGHPVVFARPAPPEIVTIQPSNPRSTFDHLLGAEPGSRFAGVSDLKRYLTKFGYFNVSGTNNYTDSFDAPLSSAVFLYQSKLGLPATGRLDNATLSQLATPRCGVSDATAAAGFVSHFAYFPGKPRWSRPRPMSLTYALSPSNTIDYIGRDEIRSVLKRAFRRWSGVIPVSFTESDEYYSADVKVAFYGGDHGDGEAFDGQLGVLAHAFSPESGRMHLDSAERWAVDFGAETSSVAVDLESVATHEIGHVLGLAHSAVKESIMYPSLSPRTRKVDLRVDDVEGVQALYGSNPNFSFSSLLESDTSDAAHHPGLASFVSWVTIWRVFVVLMVLSCV